ncbi:hypothetical protein [Cryptosporangium sp. NPDC051539]|uniref:hypothetical protein n=1 Tax=Cryptosporangium sp. NPDC051539 TaxID=3363962 RepID=UPI0037A174F1
MARSRNARLAARMAQLGFTRQGLADEVNRVMAGCSAANQVATVRWVYRLLSGQTLWPQTDYRAALEQVFGCSALDLGFIPPVGYRGPLAAPSQVPVEADMNRRRFLLIAGITGTVSLTLPELGGIQRLGMADLERLAQPLKDLRALDQQRGGAALAAAANEVVTEIERLVDQVAMTERVRTAVCGLQGQYLAAAGWFALDAGSSREAAAYLDRAHTAAALARDSLLQSQIWNLMAYRASEAERWGEVLAIAQAGTAGPGARREPRIAAVMHGWSAEGYAAQGLVGASNRAVGRAHDALGKAIAGPPAVWLEFVDHAEVDAFACNAARSLGRYRLAEDLAQRALSGTAPMADRNRASRGLMLADARLSLREVDGAVEAAAQPLEQVRTLRSGRLLRRFHAVRDDFAHWDDSRAARDWVDRFDATISA